jgi:hypothetical protein
MNPEKRTMLIQSSVIDDPESYPIIGKSYSERGSLIIGSVTLVDDIFKSNDWDKSLRYKIVASFNEVSNVAIFDFSAAVST